MMRNARQPAFHSMGRCYSSFHPKLPQQPRWRFERTLKALNTGGHIEDGSPRQEISQEALSVIVKSVAIATMITTIAALGPSPAYAGEWRPRRHLRRIQDEALETGAKTRAALHDAAQRAALQAQHAQAAAAASSQQDSIGSLFNQAKKSIKKTQRQIQRSLQGDGAYSVGISGRPDPSSYYSRPSSAVVDSSPLGWWVVVAALVGTSYAVWGHKLRKLWSQGGSSENGRWVRDRSLGGKLVFVPDVTDAPSPRPLWVDDDDFTSELTTAATARAGPSTSSGATSLGTTTAAGGGRASSSIEDVEPTWWAPPAPVGYVSASRKEELTKQARATLRELEDYKLQGIDYPSSSLVTLRRLCHEAGGAQVRPPTENGRDSIFRAVVRFALQAALRPSPASDLGGYEPGRFVSGLAHDLTVPSKRAIIITHGEVAATCRSALIDAEAAYRAADESRLLYSLGRMVAILDAFQLPSGSAEAELVGRTIQAQTTLEFRRAVFLAAGSANLNIAPIVAEMMGFDPGQVMEQLKMQIAVAAASSGGSSGGEGGAPLGAEVEEQA